MTSRILPQSHVLENSQVMQTMHYKIISLGISLGILHIHMTNMYKFTSHFQQKWILMTS